MVFDRLNARLQATLTASLILHGIALALFGLRPDARTKPLPVLTDVDYLDISQLSAPAPAEAVKPRPAKPKPKEIVDLAARFTPAPAAPAEPEEPETGQENAEAGSGTGAFLPFYAVEQVPVFETRILPAYPDSAKKLGRTSKVVAEAYIDNHGMVRKVRIVKSGGEGFDQAVLQALLQSKFRPALINGNAVPVRILIPYEFALEGC